MLEQTAPPCKLCGSDQETEFIAEIAIHFPGWAGLNKPHVWVFPELFVCLNCGKSEFAIPEEKLRLLGKGEAAAGGLTARSAQGR